MHVVTRQHWSHEGNSEYTSQPIAGTAGSGCLRTWLTADAIPEEREPCQPELTTTCMCTWCYIRENVDNLALLVLAVSSNEKQWFLSRDDGWPQQARSRGKCCKTKAMCAVMLSLKLLLGTVTHHSINPSSKKKMHGETVQYTFNLQAPACIAKRIHLPCYYYMDTSTDA